MLAVIKTGGKQYIVKIGQKLKVEKLKEKEGSEVIFTEVLLLEKDGKIEIGTPFVKNAQVKAKILKHSKAKKKIVFKYKSKTRYKKKKGHRQPYTEIEILEIKS